MIGQSSTQTAIMDQASGNKAGVTGDRLKVDTTISSISGAVTASFSSKTRIDLITTPVVLSTGVYTSVYSYTGTGYLIGFSTEFNNSSISVRVQVDGENVLTGSTLATLGGFNVTTNSTDRRQSGSGIVVSGSNLDWSFKQPIRFTGNITISADAGGGGVGARQLSQAVVYIIKET